MRRRSRAGGEPVKAQRRKAATLKRRSGPKTVRRGSSSAAGEETEVARLTRELNESSEQQTATADVLKVISRSTFDLQTVLDTLTKSAARLCAADKGVIFQRDGELYRLASNYGFSPEAERYAAEHPLRPDRGSTTGRVALEGRAIHVPDVLADQEYRATGYQEAFGYRTNLGVPLLREGTTIGVFVLTRDKVNPFTEKQIELVTTFADQAVIAIENVRLFEAEQQRTRELAESLEQQTATSDVLRVISSSPGDLQPVFEAMLENAVRICDAKFGGIYRIEGDTIRLVSTHSDVPAAYAGARRFAPFRPSTKHYFGRMMAARTVLHIADTAAEEGYLERRPEYVAAVELGGVRTFMAVPMLKENEPIGAFLLARQEVRPFTEKQIGLVTSFANQAVIAIENTRLLSALRQRTDELGRSVDELRALGEVSQAVNSTLDLENVLSTIVAKAVQLSGTEAGAIYVFDDMQGKFYLRATYGMDQELIDKLTRQHIGLDETNVAQALAQHEPVQIADLNVAAPSAVNDIILRAGYRALLVAPLLRGEDIVGMLVVRRKTSGAFPRNTVDLIKTFAAQSALAIENARLFQNIEALAEGFADRTGPPCPDGEARLTWPADRRYRTRDQEPAQFRQQFLGRLGRTHRRIAGGAWRRTPRQQATRGDQRDRRYAARQSRQGRAARQARRRDRQEHAAALASGFRRAPVGRYQCPGRREPQSRLSRSAGREAGLQYHPGEVL